MKINFLHKPIAIKVELPVWIGCITHFVVSFPFVCTTSSIRDRSQIMSRKRRWLDFGLTLAWKIGQIDVQVSSKVEIRISFKVFFVFYSRNLRFYIFFEWVRVSHTRGGWAQYSSDREKWKFLRSIIYQRSLTFYVYIFQTHLM